MQYFDTWTAIHVPEDSWTRFAGARYNEAEPPSEGFALWESPWLYWIAVLNLKNSCSEVGNVWIIPNH